LIMGQAATRPNCHAQTASLALPHITRCNSGLSQR